MVDTDFKKIAVIGAGTMGSGIAGQIANAGHKVLLLDLPRGENRNDAVEAAKARLAKSDPPSLMHKSCLDLIEVGNTEDDFDRLAECDWIIEAVVERLPIKKDLYNRLNAVISDTCIVTSNTSTIPISLLVEDMDVEFRKRFAITHYFNPVRYMRLLELVRGTDTDENVMARLARYNDEVLGKGVVTCNDTPGFLGNRVGVFALQVGMDEAVRNGLSVEHADALMGRPMGIPKTGVFGLYDLIGVDLMSDVVSTLGDILPADDAFHAVGWPQNPVRNLIEQMIADGFTGDKGKGGFYRAEDGHAVDVLTGQLRPRDKKLPAKAIKAADDLAAGKEPLTGLIAEDGTPQTAFARRMLARVLAYAASLIPNVTQSPQDIDDAMKLGFNWIRGPFEMMDALGADTVVNLINDVGVDVPPALALSAEHGPFYAAEGDVLNVLNFKDLDNAAYNPVVLPEGTQRFSLMRQTLTPIAQNEAASLFEIDGDLRLIEFHSKANALTASSMEIVRAAAKDHGAGILVHNDAQHFSAGVDLNRFRAMIEASDWNGIDAFLNDFQQSVRALLYSPVPVIGAPSGLGLGGGYEVLAHCDKLVAHANSVLGLVEASVGVIPSGGGVKETYLRWLTATNDAKKAAWNTWMQVGYSQTGASPQMAAKYQYFLPDRDISVMNRDKLITRATAELRAMADGYAPRKVTSFTLPGNSILPEMSDFMDDGIKKGWFFPHDKTVAMTVATIVVNVDADEPLVVSEQDMYDRERAAFLRLAKTKETLARIVSMLDDGEVIRN